MSRKNKQHLKQVVITTDGKRVFTGLYKFYETIGLPLDVLLSCFHAQNIAPDWMDFYKSARQAGMGHDRIISKLEEAISDSFGRECSDQVIFTLDKIFKSKENQ
jgi:hypothetical protein